MEEKRYILKGEPDEIEKVIRENRIRISRGVISINPAEPESPKRESGRTDDDVKKMRKERDEALGENTKLKERVAELECALADFNKATEDTKEVPANDDFKEVDLDADTKETETADTKEVTAEDAKEVKPAKKTTKK